MHDIDLQALIQDSCGDELPLRDTEQQQYSAACISIELMGKCIRFHVLYRLFYSPIRRHNKDTVILVFLANAHTTGM